MLHYPKTPGSRNAGAGPCVAFEKYDGTNLHWEWDRDFGWHRFGPRRAEFNLTGCSGATMLTCGKPSWHFTRGRRPPQPPLRKGGRNACWLAEGIEKVFREHGDYRKLQRFKVFTEFLGPYSFAGLHKAEDPKELRLFDVWADPLGMIGPRRFVMDFGHLHTARVVYEGKLTNKFKEDVRLGKHGVSEG